MAGSKPGMTSDKRSPCPPGFVLQIGRNIVQRETIDHFRLRRATTSFGLCSTALIKVPNIIWNAKPMLRVFAAIRPRPIRASNQRRSEIDHGASGGADRSPSLRIDALILRGRTDHADVAAHDIDGDFDDSSTSRLQPGTEIVLIAPPRRATAASALLAASDISALKNASLLSKRP